MKTSFYKSPYFLGYKSSKYMEKSYTTNSLADSGTKPDNIPDDLDIQNENVIWDYSKNRMRNLYNIYSPSSPEKIKEAQKLLDRYLDVMMTRLSGSGVDSSNLDMLVRLIEDRKLSSNLIITINKDYKISRNVSDDLDKLYEAYINKKDIKDVFVPEFEDAEAAAEGVKTGDVCQIRGDKNISIKLADGSIKKLFITPETYLELFPPVERFIVSQNDIGDCYLLSSINSINQNPSARYKLLEMFRQNPDDTVDVVFGGFQYDKKGQIVPKNPDNLVLEDIANKIPRFRIDKTSSCTTEGVRAIEVLNEFERRKLHDYCNRKMYEDFKQNGTNASDCMLRPYTEDEIKYFISYVENHGIDEIFCLQDVSAAKKFTLSKEEVEKKLSSLRNMDDDISKYKVLILERWIKSMDETGVPGYSIFGESLPKEIIRDLFKDTTKGDLYYNNAGVSSDIFEKFGFKVVLDKENVSNSKEELFTDNPQNYVYTCGTNDEKAEQSDGKFLSDHAYSLEPVDIKGERMFAVKNPHNSMEEIILTYDELDKYFSKITAARI